MKISVGARDTYYADNDDREVRIGNIPLTLGSTRDLHERIRKAIGSRKKRKHSAGFEIRLRQCDAKVDAQNVSRQITWVLSGINSVFGEQKKP